MRTAHWILILLAITVFGMRQTEKTMDRFPGEGFVAAEDGAQLYYRLEGSGSSTVVIPNGLYLLKDFKHLADARTLIFYDVRNRGRSESITDPARLARGILQDVDDLEAVRRHFGIDRIDLIGHSYIGMMVALYAMKYPDRVNRVVQIGAIPPDTGKEYPPVDNTLVEVFGKIAQLRKGPPSGDAETDCKKFWSVLRVIYVTDPADAEKIDWGRCDLPNERNFMKYWIEFLDPSIRNLKLTTEQLSSMKAPLLSIHGTRDRSAACDGAKEWMSMLPDARLVTVENGGHAPWIENRELVFRSIETFLAGNWPEMAKKFQS